MFRPLSCLLVILNTACCYSYAQPVRVSVATCESRAHPMGVPLHGITFSWQLESRENNIFQKAYQLVIGGNKQLLQQNNFDIYNSGRQESGQSLMVACKEVVLQPGTVYYWKVKVWDNNNQSSAWSGVRSFTTGLFEPQDWSGAKWIGYETLPDAMLVKPGVPDTTGLGNKAVARTVIPYFRKMFSIHKKPVSALAFVTGLGQYEMSVNGRKAGNGFLSPGWTYYDKKCLYNVYDITHLISRGSNAIGVIAGNGFYNINRERYYKLTVAFGAPKMICKVKILYDDGSSSILVSDESWKTTPSPIVFSSIYGGEDYNAVLEQSGWDRPVFDDAKWKNALPVTAPPGKLEPEMDYAVQVMDTISTKKTIRLDRRSWLYDFGQNVSGIVVLKVKGSKGDTIKIIPAELINKSNHANQGASGKPYYFTYVLKGTGVETWQPKFSYYGFRYAQVECASPAGNPAAPLPDLLSITSLHTRNSTPATGSFTCSDTLFNKINTLIQWAIKSNMQSVITDCPHREKLGWMEQNYLMGTSIQYNYNIQLLYRKLVGDMMDAQRPNGLVPDIAPEYVVFSDGFVDSPEWGSAAVIMPWLLYQWYGDTETMHRAYDMMKRYVYYLQSKSDNYILSHGLGDWYDYGPRFPGKAQLTPIPLTATAIYYYDVVLLAKMAGIMNDGSQQEKLNVLAAAVKSAFNQKFFDSKNKLYATGSQTAMAMPLVTGLVEETSKKAVLQNMVDSIYANGKALKAGDIGFHFLVKALDDGGASQLLYDMNNRSDVAGYGFQLKKGATALTESWSALEEVSNNHLMLGHMMEWLYSGLAGIGQEENSIGYRHIKIRPQPVGSINSASARFECPYGLIVSEWKKSREAFLLHVRIPVNTSATVYLPASEHSKIYEGEKRLPPADIKLAGNSAIIHIQSGEYWFRVK